MPHKKKEPRYSLAANEKLHVLYVFQLFRGNLTHTARELGIGLRTLQRKLREWKVDRKAFMPNPNADYGTIRGDKNDK